MILHTIYRDQSYLSNEICLVCKIQSTGMKVSLDGAKYSICTHCVKDSVIDANFLIGKAWWKPKDVEHLIDIRNDSKVALFILSVENNLVYKVPVKITQTKPVYWKFKAGDVRIKEWKKKESTVEFTLENGSSNEISIVDFESHAVMVNE